MLVIESICDFRLYYYKIILQIILLNRSSIIVIKKKPFVKYTIYKNI